MMLLSEHPRFAEGLSVLRRFQQEPPTLVKEDGTAAPALPCRPAEVQRALTLLTASEVAEHESLTLKLAAAQQRATSLRRELTARCSVEQDAASPLPASVGEPDEGEDDRSAATLRRRAATNSHVALLNAVWRLFHLQLQSGSIREWHDTRALQDAMALLGVTST